MDIFEEIVRLRDRGLRGALATKVREGRIGLAGPATDGK